MQRRLGPLLVALVLFAPLALASEGEDTLTAASPVLFNGPVELLVSEGALLVATDEPSQGTFVLTGGRAVGTWVSEVLVCRDLLVQEQCYPVPEPRPGEESFFASFDLDEVAIVGTASTTSPLSFLASTVPDDATHDVESEDGGSLFATLDGVTSLSTASQVADDCEQYACSFYDGSEDVFGLDWAVQNDAWNVAGDGFVHLVFFGMDVRVTGVGSDGPFSGEYRTGTHEEDRGAYTEKRVERLVVDVEDAQWTFVAPVPGAATGSLEIFSYGTTTFEDASGTIEVDGEPVTLDGEDRTFEANLTVVPVEAIDDDHFLLKVAGDAPALAIAPDTAELPAGAATAAAGVGFAILGAAAVVYYWPWLKYVGSAMMVVPMYSRIGREDVLEHGKREEIFGLIRGTPGIHAHEISSRAAVGWGTTVYHLKLLENHGLIVGKRTGRYKRFFATAGGAARQVDHYAVLRNDTTAAIAKHVLAHPGCIQKDVCQALGLAPSLVTWHMNRLEEVDLVKKVREGRTVKYYAGGSWQGLSIDFAPTAVTVEPTLVDAGSN